MHGVAQAPGHPLVNNPLCSLEMQCTVHKLLHARCDIFALL